MSGLPRRALLALVPVVALAGCSLKEVDSGSVEEQIAKDIGRQLGAAPKVDCPGGQKPEKGTTFDCDVTLRGQTGAAKVVMTSEKTFTFTFNGDGAQTAPGATTTTP